jgi:hypothetical protein
VARGHSSLTLESHCGVVSDCLWWALLLTPETSASLRRTGTGFGTWRTCGPWQIVTASWSPETSASPRRTGFGMWRTCKPFGTTKKDMPKVSQQGHVDVANVRFSVALKGAKPIFSLSSACPHIALFHTNIGGSNLQPRLSFSFVFVTSGFLHDCDLSQVSQ